jgi:alpha-glucosidase
MKALEVQSAGVQAQSLVCHLKEGGSLTVRLLGGSLARVTLKPAQGFKEPRTWAIAPLPSMPGAEGLKAASSSPLTHDVPWQGRERESLEGFDLPSIQVNEATLSLSTQRLRVDLQTHPLRLSWHDARVKPVLDSAQATTPSASAASSLIAADRVTSGYMSEQRTGAVRHYLERVVGKDHTAVERHYGLGDKTGRLDLTGRRLRTGGMDSIGYDAETGDPLYKHWPFTLSRTANGQWLGMYYDTLTTCTFDFGCEHDNYHGFYRYVEIDDGDLDYYLMVGDSPAEVLAQWLRLIGGTHLPPAWSLGFAQTAMGLADAPDAQAQLDQFIDKVKAHHVPISSFHYGSGYSSRGKKRYVFTWNQSKFPDPKKLNAKFQAQGMRLVANIKPCLLDDHPAYAEVKAAGGFIQNARTQEPIVEPYWDGMGSHLDFTKPSSVAWWQRHLKAQVLDYGIDAGWNDNNEYAILDDDAQSAGFGKSLPMHRSRPLHSLLMTRATFEAQQAHSKENAFTVSRAGSPGIQRYAQTWSGDNTTSWHTLKWNIRTGLQMSLSGLFNVGHDVGGFYGRIPDAELFVRWVQACALNPRMVMNSWKEGGVSNVPWMHPEVTPHVIAAIELRYQLMPYLQQCFERASSHHEPIIRPTFYDFPHDPACYADCDDFMLGADYLVAPVVQEGVRAKEVYLPQLNAGQHWRNFHTGEVLPSGQRHTVDAPLDRLPLFVRQAAISMK